MKYNVNMQANVDAMIEVDVDDEKLAKLAKELEKNVDDLTQEDVYDLVSYEAYQQGVPGICAQCSGWGRNHSLDIGDYEIVDGDDAIRKVE